MYRRIVDLLLPASKNKTGNIPKSKAEQTHINNNNNNTKVNEKSDTWMLVGNTELYLFLFAKIQII